MSWTAIVLLAVGSYVLKATGVALGGRLVAPGATRVILLLPSALFAGVVVLQTFERSGDLVLDARAMGLVVALVATWRRLPFIAIIALAMAATAVTRSLA